jgi:hypothetical protein
LDRIDSTVFFSVSGIFEARLPRREARVQVDAGCLFYPFQAAIECTCQRHPSHAHKKDLMVCLRERGFSASDAAVASDTAQKIGLFLSLDAAVASDTENHCPCK